MCIYLRVILLKFILKNRMLFVPFDLKINCDSIACYEKLSDVHFEAIFNNINKYQTEEEKKRKRATKQFLKHNPCSDYIVQSTIRFIKLVTENSISNASLLRIHIQSALII